MTAPRELADFDPETGHLHTTCAPRFDGYHCHGDGGTPAVDCAAHLYAIAQDAEHAAAVQRTAPVVLVLHTDGRADLTVADQVDDNSLGGYLEQVAAMVRAGEHRNACAQCAELGDPTHNHQYAAEAHDHGCVPDTGHTHGVPSST